MRQVTLLLLLVFAFAVTASAESDKVIKVLPHFLDLKGRASLNPSLFDRDAYQARLRQEPASRSGIRFDVNWRSSFFPDLRLRVEAKGAKGREPKQIFLERPVKAGPTGQWTALTLSGEDYKNFGELISWRAILLSGTNVVAEQKSFLW